MFQFLSKGAPKALLTAIKTQIVLAAGSALIGQVNLAGATAITSDRKVVTTAGTRVQVSSSSLPCREVIVTAETDNTGLIAVGNAAVVCAEGTQKGTILKAGQSAVFTVSDVNLLYIDSTVNGDGISYSYLL